MTHTSKFTLWTNPKNKELLERVRGKTFPEIRNNLFYLILTRYQCDFCGECPNLDASMTNVACDPDSYIFEDELIKCGRCILPSNARILCTPDSEKLFHYAKEHERRTLFMYVYNTSHDYFLPVFRPEYCRIDFDDGCAQSITHRQDPYYQIDRSLFQILYDLLEKLQDSS